MIENVTAFERFKEHILRDGPRLGPNDKFCFECHPGLECFNRCCHDVNIFLTPYDIIRLKNRLGIASGEFLNRHCIVPFGKDLKYPIVMLKMGEDDEKACPFLDKPKGCSVYADRPWSCRMYPLGRAAPPKGDTEQGGTFYFLLNEDICRGNEQSHEWTVAEWLDNQGVGEYDVNSRFFQDLAQDPRLQEKGLDEKQMDMLFMVCYDVDRLRRFVFETKFLTMFEIPEETIEAIRTDDTALMKLGFEWIRFALWKEITLKIRDEVVQAKLAEAGKEK